MHRVHPALLLAALTAGALLLPACGGAPPPPAPAPPAAFVGEVDTPAPAGADPLIAVEVVDGRVQAFVCDGNGVWAWFEGPATGADVTLAAETATAGDLVQPAGLTLRLAPATVTGTVTFTDGAAVPVTLAPAAGLDGLYQAASITTDGTFDATTATGNTADGLIAPDGALTLTLAGVAGRTQLTGTADGLRLADAAGFDGVRQVVLGERVEGKTRTGSSFYSSRSSTSTSQGAETLNQGSSSEAAQDDCC